MNKQLNWRCLLSILQTITNIASNYILYTESTPCFEIYINQRKNITLIPYLYIYFSSNAFLKFDSSIFFVQNSCDQKRDCQFRQGEFASQLDTYIWITYNYQHSCVDELIPPKKLLRNKFLRMSSFFMQLILQNYSRVKVLFKHPFFIIKY